MISGGVCAAKGFKASGIHCGIRKNKSKKDLALIFSEKPASTAAVYTTNLVKGAPIYVNKKHLSDGIAQAMICNSGIANTCNANGVEIAELTCDILAKELKIKPEDVVVASTGVIGMPLDINPIKNGIPGNALGAYLNGSEIDVYGNAQDATGDTMNDGTITIHGNCGDACGYGMRDGKIFIKGSAGYRAGIHMKEYQTHIPMITIGGKVGDFLGEYLAGGRLIVLGIDFESECPVGSFCGTGMHGGAIYIRSEHKPVGLPIQVCCHDATQEDIESIRADVEEFSEYFGYDAKRILSSHFYKLTPNSASPYKQLYVNN